MNKSCSSQCGSEKSNEKPHGEKSEPGKQREKIKQLLFSLLVQQAYILSLMLGIETWRMMWF